eukprot:jgi/Chlat1/804/Chrsp104S01255
MGAGASNAATTVGAFCWCLLLLLLLVGCCCDSVSAVDQAGRSVPRRVLGEDGVEHGDDSSQVLQLGKHPRAGACQSGSGHQCDVLVSIVTSQEGHDRLALMKSTWLAGVPHLFVSSTPDPALDITPSEEPRFRARTLDMIAKAAAMSGSFKWLVVGSVHTYFVLSNLVPFLQELDHTTPYFLGALPADTSLADHRGEVCSWDEPHPCRSANQSYPPYWPSFRAGFVLSEGLVRALGVDTWRSCFQEKRLKMEPTWAAKLKDKDTLEVAYCIYANGYALSLGPPLAFHWDKFAYEPLNPPVLSPWRRPFSLYAPTEEMTKDILAFERAEFEAEQRAWPACFKDDDTPMVWEYNNFRGIGDRIIDFVGAWSVAWVKCKRIWLPWKGRTQGLPAWEDLFLNNLEGAKVVTVRDYKQFEERIKLVLPHSEPLGFPDVGSGRAFPETLYTYFNLHQQGVSWRQFQLTYQMLAKRLQIVPKVDERLEEMRQKVRGAIGLHIRRGDKVNARYPGPWTLTNEQLKLLDEKTHEFIVEILQRYPKTTFFIATDSQEAEEDYKETVLSHDGNVVLVPKVFGGGFDHGVSGALDDLQLLAETAGILQSCTVSSFSGVASFLGTKPLLNLLPNNTYFGEGPKNVNAAFLYDIALLWEQRHIWLDKVKDALSFQ